MKLLITLMMLLIIYSSEAKLFPVVNNNGDVYIDSTGRVVLSGNYEPKFTKALIQVNGHELVDIDFNRSAYFHSGMAFVNNPSKFFGLFSLWDDYCFIDSTGRVTLDVSYENVSHFVGDFASFLVQDNPRQYGLVDKKGEWVSLKNMATNEWVYRLSFITPFYEGKALTLASETNRAPFTYAFFKDGILSIDNVSFVEADIYSDSVAAFKRNTLWGYMDHEYNTVIKPQFDFANAFHNGYAKVFKDGSYGYINKKGEYSIEPKYEQLGEYSEGLISALQGEKWGVLDINGNWVIKPQYNSIGDCHNGLIPVEIDGRYGFINKKNEIVISANFNYVEEFDNGIAKAWVYDELYYINTKGEIVWTLLDKDEYNSVLQDIKSASN